MTPQPTNQEDSELFKTLTKLAEEVRIAYVLWEKDQSYDGEKAEYDLVREAEQLLLAWKNKALARRELEGRVDEVEHMPHQVSCALGNQHSFCDYYKRERLAHLQQQLKEMRKKS